MRVGIIAAVAIVLAAPFALAGPLDRQAGDLETRSNPAANNMLRVPGVIGAAPEDAMGQLQQAGLTPQQQVDTQANPKYAGQEGLVVSQMPLPGGVAMLGSSVTIVVYQPTASPSPQTNGGQQAGSGDAGNGLVSASPGGNEEPGIRGPLASPPTRATQPAGSGAVSTLPATGGQVGEPNRPDSIALPPTHTAAPGSLRKQQLGKVPTRKVDDAPKSVVDWSKGLK